MKLSVKFLACCLFLVALVAGVGVYSITRMADINHSSEELSTNWMPSIKVLGELSVLCNTLKRTELLHLLTTDERRLAQLEREMEAMLAQIDRKLNEYATLITEPEEFKNLPNLIAAWKAYQVYHFKALELSRTNRNDAAAQLAFGEARILFNRAIAILGILVDVNYLGGQHSADRAVAQYHLARSLILLVMVLSCAGGIVLSLAITRGVTNQLGEDPGYLHAVTRTISEGNLEAEFKPVKREGSVYGVLIRMIDSLRNKIRELDQRSVELKAKNDELEQVFYVASHDLRSPLVNIDGYSKELAYSLKDLRAVLDRLAPGPEALRDVAPIMEKDIPECLRFIQTSTGKMDALLSGLLKLSRSGRAALRIEVLDMNALVANVVDATEFRIKQAGVALDVGVLPPCLGDHVQVGQVFTNLLDNALKYLSPDRPGVVGISGRVEGACAVYCVEDNGIGIAPAHQEVIFEIFHRLDPSSGGGEGLGLTIVKRILARLDGEIWVRSEEGAGSRFYVALPAADGALGPRREGKQ